MKARRFATSSPHLCGVVARSKSSGTTSGIAIPTTRAAAIISIANSLPLLDFLEGIPPEAGQPLFSILNTLPDWEHVTHDWNKARRRLASDPDGAITSARALLESVCKHILDDAGIGYKADDSLPNLYYLTVQELNLAPGQHQEEGFKKILGNAQAVVNELAALRNDQGDAHGKGRKAYRPAARHAELAVGFAGTIASFLVSTWQQRKG